MLKESKTYKNMPKKIYIRTFGCQMNSRDSEVIKGVLSTSGYKMVDNEKEADVVLFNTCSVRQHAEDRVWSAIGKIAKVSPRPSSFDGTIVKATRRGDYQAKKIIGVIGCMAQNYKSEIFKRSPYVDIVCGPSNIGNIASYIEEAIRKKQHISAVEEKNRAEEIYHTGFYEEKNHAYIVISEGCDNYCSYCVVPYVRGRLRHRKSQDIIREVNEAVAKGINNITLLGQNVNSYLAEKINFVELLKSVSEIKGIKSLSFVTSHPKDVTKKLFEVMADNPVIKKCLHMPVQSGSDKILKAMNRGYAAKKYLDIVELYRSIVYNGQLGTDIIVGFPGETEEDFKNTLDLVREIEFDSAYIFKYSPRPHTKAAELEDDVPLSVKKRRHSELLELQRRISRSKS